jgi:GTP-binding protein
MEIRTASYVISSPDIKSCPPPDRPEYAFIGRSNVGKSSLINMITNIDKLAKTSATPGKTRLINHFAIESINPEREVSKWYLVDLPGYGFAKVSHTERKKWEKMIEDYLRKRSTLMHVFQLVDGRHSPQRPDLDFVNNLGRWRIPFTLVFTKSDKENQRTVQANIKAFLDKMLESWEFLPPHLVSSAVKKTGRDSLLRLIGEMNDEWEKANKRGL